MEVQERPGDCSEGGEVHGIGLLARRFQSDFEKSMSIVWIGEVAFELPVIEGLEESGLLGIGFALQQLLEAEFQALGEGSAVPGQLFSEDSGGLDEGRIVQEVEGLLGELGPGSPPEAQLWPAKRILVRRARRTPEVPEALRRCALILEPGEAVLVRNFADPFFALPRLGLSNCRTERIPGAGRLPR